MAFTVPTLAEVTRTVENGCNQAFYGSSGPLRFGVLKIISKVIAASCYLPILACASIMKNYFEDTADVDGLLQLGSRYPLPPKPASRARGKVVFNGTPGTIPAGTILVNASNAEYELLTAVTISSEGSAVGQVYASQVGSEFNIESGTELSFRDLDLEFVQSVTVDSEGLYGGVSVAVSIDGVEQLWGETVEQYRARLKYRRQNPPQGGTDSDYMQWALGFSQVTHCWVEPNWPLTNSVTVFVADFNAATGELNSTEIAEVQEFIMDRRPNTAEPVVVGVNAVSMALSVFLPVVNDYYKTAALEALKTYFLTKAPGTTVTLDECRNAIKSGGVIQACTVGGMSVGGVEISSGSYQLSKLYSGTLISGEVVNVNVLENNVSFGVLS